MSRSLPFAELLIDGEEDRTLTHDEAERMLRDIEILLARDVERHGPNPQGHRASPRRGLLRLREMVAFCRDHPGSTIVQNGD
jgi:hypothetical protein